MLRLLGMANIVRPRRDLKKHFLFIVLFCEEKYQKSARRTHAVLLANLVRRARVSRTSHAWQVRAANGGAKIGSLAILRGFSHTTRANISHEKAEQIRARIVCTPAYKGVAGVGLVHTLTGLSK